MKLKLTLKLLLAALTRIKFRYAVIMIWYDHFPFFMLFIFTVGKESGNNEAASAIPSTYTLEITNILSVGYQLNLMLTSWAVMVFHFVS